MNNFQVVSFEDLNTKSNKVGFIHDKSATKTALVFAEDQKIGSYGTTPRINRDRMLAMLQCEPADESKLPDILQEYRNKLMNPVSFKKGECASLMDEGKLLTGRVIKGGKNRIVVAIENGNVDIEIDAGDCKPVQLPKATGAMANWEVGSYKIVNGHDDSTPYVADILHKGKKALISENDGWGGPDMVGLAKGIKPEVEHQFYDDLKAAINSAVGESENIHDTAGLWVKWDYYVRPSGELSFEDYLKKISDSVDALSAA